ncbi:hypothetical protein [Pseudomonas tolaasii]|uniref:hypothetical protein n=1 Tax=Pseudomonas tolaasii TaxID=29442 RepID=UPI0027326A50|nr:hypothetical protein [Pseudomonas tolaasii]WLH51289.1 hypothetical protein PSH62_24945 [Pseudomonas tolaasii]
MLVAKQVAAIEAQGQCQVGVEAAFNEIATCRILSKLYKIMIFKGLEEYRRMEKTLTIIKGMQCFPFYPIAALPPDVVDLMQRACDALGERVRGKSAHLIRSFDVYCHVTGASVTYLSLSRPEFKRVVQGFLGALDGESLLPVGTQIRSVYKHSLIKLVTKMRDEVPMLPEFTSADSKPGIYENVWQAMQRDLDPVALRYWNGWIVQGRNGNKGYLPIAYLWNSHGPEFAEDVFERYRNNTSKKLAPSHSEFNTFIYYLADNKERWPPSTFQNPLEIKRLFIDFMVHSFKRALASGTDLSTRTRSYSKFIYAMDETFLQSGAWVKPFAGALPKPISKSPPGSKTNTKQKPDGTVVKDKLITEVPMHLTDSDAIEILFKKIHEDNALVLKWAKYRLEKAKESYEVCVELAQTGTVITGGNNNVKTIEEIGAENICATYQTRGITYFKDNLKQVLGKTTKSEAYKLLGIPSVDTIFALQMLLIYGHPNVTDTFFLNLELYNKKGTLTGFTKTESGAYQLTGYKDRAGGPNSERKILLSDEEAEWVKLMISMTKVLRDDLRSAGNDDWRYMFLQTAGRFTRPSKPESMKLSDNRVKFRHEMVREFMVLGNRDKSATEGFMARLSLTAFRASAAVEIFLRDHDVEEMARALGHKRYDSSLLSSYLPEPILAFFQTRWIRLFQRGIICMAMKDSPRLLEVTRFANMEELHLFLENHALRDIPEHLKNPDYLKKSASLDAANDAQANKQGQVIVSIDTGVLTALLSLRAAVTEATERAQKNPPGRRLCSKAIYWSRFTDLVVKEIEEGLESELIEHLECAQEHLNATHMEDLIYATAS